MKRKGYPLEFKLQAVQLVKEQGQGVSEVARNLGMPKSTLFDWVNEQEQQDEEAKARRNRASGEVLRLKRELEQVTKERDFLKKACAFFAQTKDGRSK